MHSEGTIVIDRPIDEVFHLTCDRVPEWSIIVVEEELLEKTPDGVGTRFRTVTEDHGKRMVFEGVVTRYEPPVLNAIQLTGRQFDIEAVYTFEDLGGQTRVTQHSVVEGKGFFKVFLALFGWAMHKANCQATQRELESLKTYCETQPATTP
ncbi:Polyketide cyclase / dehydrase and lipid transport [Maioricimonas rarisocia]|uniref:Polyketide cyclase / dehydrase and lipid transport n=1 Tax=Maioricimonas rarisocia TaxID=2528026 RepID=A0A517Z1J3_9PLAN|nr:SRPBCC family protein [Maioricimonas rarisocia]QDU36350.1 Polyketide cyclase / dehydrase and lipid transport [Maioricimonas rarisocia]